MRYGSVCSGIEAATVAWHPLGWSPAFFSEIERFPSEVLAHHYGSNLPGEPIGSGVPNLGDMTKFQEWPDYAIDLLVGGTPCQSYSIGGLRAGLADPRGSLMLTYLAIASRYRARWVVWENVPGVLSSNGGHDFAALLGGLGQLGYGYAYRVLDAQFSGVAQQRRRVFVVGYLGDWRRAVSVLFEPDSFSGREEPKRAPAVSVCLTARGAGSLDDRETYVADETGVRHLTPLECERLQGFPDGYTAIVRRGKPAADGPRYRALGNSMAVNVMRAIGERIAMVDALHAPQRAAA